MLWPAMMTWPVRGDVVSLAWAFTFTVPRPLPLPGEADNHGVFGDAVHAQPVGASTVTAPVPPCAETDSEVGESW